MKKLILFFLGTAVLVAIVLTIKVLTSSPVSAIEAPNESYKRPSCEGDKGTRGCGDRQETACSFGVKVNC
ncbi:MAG: hypothetical protein AB7S50_06160 [Bacteroidales bacterium]